MNKQALESLNPHNLPVRLMCTGRMRNADMTLIYENWQVLETMRVHLNHGHWANYIDVSNVDRESALVVWLTNEPFIAINTDQEYSDVVYNLTTDTMYPISDVARTWEGAASLTITQRIRALNPEHKPLFLIWMTYDNLGFDLDILHTNFDIAGTYFVNNIDEYSERAYDIWDAVENSGVDTKECVVVFIVDARHYVWGNWRELPDAIVTDTKSFVNLYRFEQRHHF